MSRRLFEPSYPDVVARAHTLLAAGQFADAAKSYEQAAGLAPTRAFETDMLDLAFFLKERAEGRPVIRKAR